MLHRNLSWVTVVLLMLVSLGCVRRRMTIRSDPPGALVYVDEQEIGRTPVATPFTYYGTRKLRLIKDGFETINVKQRFPAPWYQIPPLDFFAENLYPREVRDERVVDFELVPKANVSMNEVLSHGDQLRSQAPPPTNSLATEVYPAQPPPAQYSPPWSTP